MLIQGSRPVSDWLAGGGYDGPRTSNNPIDQLFFLVVYGGGLIIASRRGVNWGKVFVSNLPLVLLYVYFLSGVTWSDDPMGSAVRIVKDFAMIFIVGQIYSEKEPLQAIRAVFIRSACVLFPLSITFNHYFPNFSREYNPNGGMLLSGVTGQKNSLGEIIFLFSIFILWDYLELSQAKRRKGFRIVCWDHLLLVGIGIFLLIQSQSKTALICLSIGAAMALRKGIFAKTPVSVTAYGAILSTPFLLFCSREFADVIEPVINALGRDMTFTGRTNIWDHITLETVNPWIGVGYWNFWQGPRGKAISVAINWSIPTAHCGYLDIYLDGGILGLSALFIVLAVYGWRLSHSKSRFRIVGLAVLSTAVIYNLSESSFLRIGPLWFAVMLTMVEFPLRKKVVKPVEPALLDKSEENWMRELNEERECLPAR